MFSVISGLQSNDRIIAATKPVLVDFGRAWVNNSIAGHHFDQMQIHQNFEPADIHNDDNPAMIVHNLQLIDGLLADPRLTPELTAQLQAVADRQRQNLNAIYGLAQTFALQDLIAHGDNTQGVLNESHGSRPIILSHNDQDVSFQDVLAGSERAVTFAPKDPTADIDPAISRKATGELANDPIFRFYEGVEQNQLATAQAENQLDATILDVVDQCKV